MDIGLVFPGCHRRAGVERSVWEAARYFSRTHQVSVYARDFDGAGLEGVRHVLVEGGRRSGPFTAAFFARAARHALRGHRHDHVISFGVGDVGADVLWVNSVHRAWLDRSNEFAKEGLRSHPLRRYLLPHHQARLLMERHYFTKSRPSAVVVVADAVGRDLTRLYGVPARLLNTIHNGYSAAEFSPDRKVERSAVRARLGLPEDALVLLMAANELHRKGFHILLDAVHQLAGPHVHILLVGRAAPISYVQRIESLGLADRVHYAGSQSDMGAVHAASDLFVLPTKYEAFCLAIVEALASGLPVVTTTTPGAGDLITDGVNGRLQHDPSDPTELAGLLREALDPQRLAKWTSGAAPSVAELEWSKLFARAEELLASLPSLQR